MVRQETEAQRDYIFGKSPLTGTWYRITEWEDKGDGKIVAHSKEEVPREDVPEEWIGATEAKMDG